MTYVLIILLKASTMTVPGFKSEQLCKAVGIEIAYKIMAFKPSEQNNIIVMCQRTDAMPRVRQVPDEAEPRIQIITD